jgi:GNAT superfamily N-acetyltransferase
LVFTFETADNTHRRARTILHVAIRQVRVSGLEYLALATKLLQRARLADPAAGVWEAADLHWWWRMPRASDAIQQLFWLDDEGPVAAVILTDWRRSWGCDPIVVRGASVPLPVLWEGAMRAIETADLRSVEVLARDDDPELRDLLASAGFVADVGGSGITWMDADDRAPPSPLPVGYMLVDRTQRVGTAHPMRRRNGEVVEERLRQSSLYDAELDLAIETSDGQTAGYALFWCDPVTKVGLVEPMRVEDAHQRRGLARAMLTAGLDRLARRGARRLKVGYGTDAARSLYVGAGFRITATCTSYTWRRAEASAA